MGDLFRPNGCPTAYDRRQCDMLYFMTRGKVLDQSTYDDLTARTDAFKRMAVHLQDFFSG